MSTDARPLLAHLPLHLLPWRRPVVPVHRRHCTAVAGLLLGTAGGELASRGSSDPGTGIPGSFTHGEIEGGQFKGALRQNFGRIRNMKSSLQWERRQQWWGRIYSSNSPKGQKFVVTRKKVNESAAFWTLAGIKQHIWVSAPHQLTLVKWRPPRTSPLPSECI